MRKIKLYNQHNVGALGNIKSIFIILVVIYCVSCSTKDENHPETIQLSIDDFEDKVLFSDYFKLSEIIYLETSDKSLIGEIDKIMVIDNNIYILDGTTNSLLSFNREGDFLYKIDKQGKGPGEYLHLGDIIYDCKNNLLLLLDTYRHRLLKYDRRGDFVSAEMKSKFPIYEMKLIDNSRMLYFSNSSNNIICNGKDFCYNLFIEKNNKIIYKGCPFPKEFKGRSYGIKYHNTLISSNKQVYLLEPFSNIIYSYKTDSLYSKYEIDFGNLTIPDDVKKSPKTLYDNENLKKYCFGMQNIYEDSDILFFEYLEKFIPRGAIFEKTSMVFKSCETYFDRTNGIPLNLVDDRGSNNFLISLLEPTAVKRFHESRKGENEPITPILKDLVNQSDDFDNPIIILYERK